jgi:hypothetical protein
MRFAAGFVLGAVMIVGGALVHDTVPPFSDRPIVSWSNAADTKDYVVEYFASRLDRLAKWATFRY